MACIPVSLFVYLFTCSLFKHFVSNSYYMASKFVLYSEGSGFEFMPILSFVVFLGVSGQVLVQVTSLVFTS